MATDDDDKRGSSPPIDPADRTVRELIDAATRAELERWFGLPSFEQLATGDAPAAPRAEDPDMIAARERREAAIAAVDPAMLEAHRRRTELPAGVLQFQPRLEVHVDPTVTLFDASMVERQASIAEPRELELPDAIQDDLKECTPQALLRDLHRPELDFDKQFEVVDFAAEQRVDGVALVDEVMRARYQIEARYVSPYREGRALLDELRASRRTSFSAATLASLPNRRVAE